MAQAAGAPLELAFFRARGDYLAARFPVGGSVLVHGQLGRFGERWQMTHPELLGTSGTSDGMLPIYPLVQGVQQGRLRAIARAALDRLPELPEWLPDSLLAERGWPGWAAALRAIHQPATAATLEAGAPACQRLAFDELLASQLALRLTRTARERLSGRALCGDGQLVAPIPGLAAVPLHALPADGDRRDRPELAAAAPMLRLLQGDVGSGKTVVALAAMLQAVEAGAQAALMAPTEVLARQHAATFGRLLAPLGQEAVLLTGKDPAAQRRAARERLASGAARLAVGTHALFQDGVEFARPRPRGDRRAAPVRRRPAARPRGQGPGGRRPADDRDADPAQPGARRLRRHRHLAAADQAAGARADRHPRRPQPSASTRSWRQPRGRSGGESGSTGSAR